MTSDEFFRSVTVQVCGDLDIARALSKTIPVLRTRVPVDRIFVQVYQPDLGAMSTLADATADRADYPDVLTPMPMEVQRAIRGNLKRYEGALVAISDPQRNPVAAEMLKFHGIEGWSVLHLSVLSDDDRIGGVVFAAQGSDSYTEEHARIIRSLSGPFTAALFNALEHREVLRLRDRLAEDNQFLSRELDRYSGEEIVGAGFGLRDVMRRVERAAVSDAPVLITGETGVGKDVVARALHRTSNRAAGPFVAVNCGAIPESLVDSELFGHEKGAFTGALAAKRGRFERAGGGTVFLDEVGEMPASAQIRLLRVLQNHEIERVGGTEVIPIDVRVIAATNRDLPTMVAHGAFREDLWYRLNVFPIHVPPLRERTGDIPALAEYFIEKKAAELKLAQSPRLASGEIETMMGYRWPGNIRELANAIERAMILDPSGPLHLELGAAPDAAAVESSSPFPTLRQVEASHIRRALARAGGKVHGTEGAAELLDMNPSTLRHRMRKLGIPFGGSS